MNSDFQRAEYYLAIEGFLLHLRNLLAFFMNHGVEPTDMGIHKPNLNLWGDGRKLHPQQYSDLMKRTREINRARGFKNRTLYVQISRFLQHCTTFRYTEPRSWDVGGIFRFRPRTAGFSETISKVIPNLRERGILMEARLTEFSLWLLRVTEELA
jgi:hypothetical protein